MVRQAFIIQAFIISAFGLLLLISCVDSDSEVNLGIDMSWSFDSLNAAGGQSYATFTLINNGTADLAGSEWAIYFSQLIHPGDIAANRSGLHFETISGDYHKMTPDSSFMPLGSGQRRSVQVSYNGFAGRISFSPVGAYIVDGKNNVTAIELEHSFPGLSRTEILEPLFDDVQSRFQENRRITDIPAKELSLIPTPVDFTLSGQNITLGSRIVIGYTNGLEAEATHLRTQIMEVFSGNVTISENTRDAHIVLSLDEAIGNQEAYQLDVANGLIRITGADAAGVFYGIQSLARLYIRDNSRERQNFLTIRGCSISDSPRFDYRGLHLDVSRNFHSLKHVRRVIDLMSFYKLNKLHFTITNDEGWRLEIPGLPELTETGSRRGHTLDEQDMLNPAYGSGPVADPGAGSGSGHYTREEFIELLRFAHQRHIEIIPEIDVPGHARAAIKAMNWRYNKYAESSELAKAEEYLLHDPDDKSEYTSAQNYHDNVVCVCQESTYRFIEKVIDELVKMYAEAEAPLNIVHSGGDEIPYGAWQKSPVCDKWLSDQGATVNKNELQPYFITRFIEILDKHNLTTGGWEEITLKTTPAGHNETAINFGFVGENVLSYVWNSTLGGGREDMAYRLANGGYQVVMCNSSALYFDLAYNRDPAEPGLTWSGYVDTRNAFEFEPMDLFATATKDAYGEPLGAEYGLNKVRLDESAKNNIRGVQGQLWSETLRNSDDIDYYLFPKMLGLAERAWSRAPDWTFPNNKNERIAALNVAWERFANTVGKVELPLLDNLSVGVGYRIPMPGAIYLGGQLQANMRYPGLQIRYTTDGTEPTAMSSLYEGPVRLEADEIRLKAFNDIGRSGRTSTVRKVRPN